jgi:hypothetical protein
LRLHWSSEALGRLKAIAGRAPRGAAHLLEAVEWLVASPFSGMHRGLAGRPGQQVLSVPPYVVFYAIEGDELTVLTRDRRSPPPAALVTAADRGQN